MYPDPQSSSSPQPVPPPAFVYPPQPVAGQAPPAPYQSSTVSAAPAIDTKIRNAAFALFGAALVVLIGLMTKSWFTARGAGLGLTGAEVCRGSVCQTISWSQLHAPSDVEAFAWLGLLSGVAAIGVAIAMGVMMMQHKAAKIPLKIFNVVLGIAAFSTTMFMMRVLTGDVGRGASLSWSGFVAIGGLLVVGGITKQVVTPLTSQR